MVRTWFPGLTIGWNGKAISGLFSFCMVGLCISGSGISAIFNAAVALIPWKGKVCIENTKSSLILLITVHFLLYAKEWAIRVLHSQSNNYSIFESKRYNVNRLALVLAQLSCLSSSAGNGKKPFQHILHWYLSCHATISKIQDQGSF